MKLLLLISLFLSFPLHAKCYQIYADRMDYALSINEDLDLGEEYTLAKAVKITNPEALGLLKGIAPKLKFSESKNLNKIIQKDLIKKTGKPLIVYPIKFLLYGQRKAYLIKQSIDRTHYYSFIIYLEEECSL